MVEKMMGAKISRSQVSAYKQHIMHDWLIPRHPYCLMGKNRLLRRRIEGHTGHELWERAVSDFIACYEDFLPLDRFDSQESIRHDWVHYFLVMVCSHIREKNDVEKAGRSKGKGKRADVPEGAEVQSAKRIGVEVAPVENKGFVVRVRGDVTNPLVYHAYTGVEIYDHLSVWLEAEARPTGPSYTISASYRCALPQEEADEIGIPVGHVFQGEVYNQETWNNQITNFRLVAPEAKHLMLEVREWEGEGESPKGVIQMKVESELEEVSARASVNRQG
jgi:hypothetical protein